MKNLFGHITKAYFLGIGGIGMSALARYFHHKGVEVVGYDKTATPLTDELIREGIRVSFEDDPDALPAWLKSDDASTDFMVVYTPAIPSDHKEFNFLISKGIQMWKRSEVLGELTRGVRTIAVAGTHGKTTTSTMIAHLLKHANMNVTAFLGGIASNYGTNLLIASDSENEIMIAEADEYDRSFLKLNPDTSVITSLDPDHLDIYGSKQNMIDSYTEFASRLKPGGVLFTKAGIENQSSIIPTQTYSADSSGQAVANNLRIVNGAYVFDVSAPDFVITDLVLNCPGRHNVENAIAATIVCNHEGLTKDEIRQGMATFKGVHRRFEYRFKSEDRIVIDDYAHHPTELAAAIGTVRELYPGKRILGVFQPHLYSRTRDFADGFAESLSKLDELIMLEIYPARELPIPGVTSSMIMDKCTAINKKLVSKNGLADAIADSSAEIIIMLGAGDIDVLVQEVVDAIQSQKKKGALNP
ncbi:MAG: UDP-N-acetylmuramate--L-alanine ligase [Bacteroidota bacterium]